MDRLEQEALAEKAERWMEERLGSAYDMLAEDSSEIEVENPFAVQVGLCSRSDAATGYRAAVNGFDQCSPERGRSRRPSCRDWH